jgi:hypothetical protein
MPNMRHIKVGDPVVRQIGRSEVGQQPHQVELVVSEVDDELIYCGPRGEGWSFDRATGAEVDHDLGWGPQHGITGTFLVAPTLPASPGEVKAAEHIT